MRKLLASLFLGLAACSLGGATALQQGAGSQWTSPGGDAGKTHHSRLTAINADNVGRLGLAWAVDLATTRGQEATPVVIDGVLYTSGTAGRAYAFDAATGKELWRFEPDVDMQVNRTVCCDMVNRGVAVAHGKVFVAALDGWMYALDARTGTVVWKSDFIEDRRKGDNSTGAPEVAGDVVVIGMGGAEYDVRGYVTALDLETGKLRWRWHVIPHDPKLGPQETPELEAALKTWDPNSRWDIGGGGSPWDAINYDPETGLVLVGTGNGGPYATSKRSPSGGDNLYLASLVALDPKTGRMKWHYQETPGDNWDFTAVQPMILTHMAIDGEDRPVILHAPKNGYLYILDRRDGKLLRANPIVRVNWAKGIDPGTGRPILDPEVADYTTGPKIIFPGTPGARNWHPASYDPATGLYIGAVLDMGNLMFMSPGQKPARARALNNDAVLIFTPDVEAALPTLPPEVGDAVRKLPAFAEAKRNPATTQIRALDPLTGKTVWAVDTAGWQDRAGVLTTASGLTIHGSVTGKLFVRETKTGKLLKEIDTGTPIMAAPMTYTVRGVQYVAVMAGWGGGGYPFVPRYSAAYTRGNMNRLLVFKLGGGAVTVPDLLPPLEVAPEAPAQAPGVTAATIARGQGLFFGNCAICHANQPRSITPDLRRMQPATHEAFNQIVLEGLLTPNGMPRWDDILSGEDADAIHAYLIDLQGKTRADEQDKRKAGKPLDGPSLTILSNY
ncbi:PQQ-dependent dehydrogenase, methanol/ethanol family [Novosphingobium sp. MMS21-SN21R]|uniref:PQQ-dependent dehydrogenase, methanol/ethanol family n=1 Tax=Novosphingobium sp. MMS21-SN21R TaxID=2969298 RepID=UPI002888713D|nr:PQQ-dependent dehydrogenase, methanol/ethanol family [Novosphingobium sp. MMS21-SN21R]MDT0509130.1 PQQ-dependent dehydrogenase, methanol/ethanol family [Novosphingobium sp. MMS21-SN21R]